MRHLVALQQLERHLWRKPAGERLNGPPVKNLSAADLNSSVYRPRGFDPFILVLLKLGGFKPEVQHLPPSKVSRCKAAHPSAINNSSLRIV